MYVKIIIHVMYMKFNNWLQQSDWNMIIYFMQ